MAAAKCSAQCTPKTETAESDGPETLDFALAAGDGYTVDPAAGASTVTFYDTLADVPDLGDGPQISLSADQTELIETEGTELTLTFNVEGDIPDGGVLVYVNSETRGALGEFNVFAGEISGGILPPPNFASSGFYFTVLEDGASITVPVFDETTNPQIPPEDAIEGVEDFTFSIVEGPGYTIDPDAGSISYSIADAPGALPLVSFTTSPEVLVEAEGTVSVHTFTVSTEPPAEGITVTVSAPNLSEFDLAQITATGGEIVGVNDAGTGFEFKITAREAMIELPIADDGEAEGIEQAEFTLAAGSGYIVSAEDNSGTFVLSDEPVAAPPRDSETNDTIATAIATGLSTDNSSLTVEGALEQQRDPAVDRTEDVDMYSVELAAGDVLRIDTDARAISDDAPDTLLRIFTADGTQVAQSDDDAAPDELFAPGRQDSYLEYTAESAGTYYVGVSSFPNGEFDFNNVPYDPNVAGSGTGRSFGNYQLNLSLNEDVAPAPTVIAPSTGDGPTVSLSATPGTYDDDDNVVASSLVQFVDDGASILTLGLTVEGEIPEGGVEVFLKSNIAVTDVFSGRAPFSPGAEVLGAVFDEAGVAVGLRVNLLSPISLLNLVLASPEEAPTDGEEAVSFTLEPSAGYVVGDNTFSTTVYDTLADVPAPTMVPEISFSVSEPNLIESENTLTTLTFDLSEAPPAEGVLVHIDSGVRGALGEFTVTNAEISGGAVPAPNFQSSGFFFRMTEQTASITLSAFDETTNPQIDPEDALEGIEELTFTVQPAAGYTVAPDAGAVTLTIADNPDSVVIPPDNGENGGNDDGDEVPFEVEFNDTIADATDTLLSSDNLSFKLQAEIDSTRRTRNLIDATEDVDMYAFELEAGETIKIDIDSIPYQLDGIDTEQRVDTELRIFNAAGEELLLNTQDPAPGELFESGRDAYVEFTAAETGNYYAGVALLSNRAYDPMVQGSGSGRVFPDFGINTGEYTIEASLADAVAGVDDMLVGTDSDDTLNGFRGNDTIAGGLGNDIIMGGSGDDVLRGDANTRDPQNDLPGGNDIIFGGAGNDRIGGKAGNDILSGDAGDDLIWGDSGDDIIMGGTGNDVLVGDNMSDGTGSDLFVFGNGDGTDTILDFEVGSDRIGLVEGELTFADLTLTQDGSNTLLGVTSSGETIAVLNGIQSSSLTESSFEVVADVSNLEEAMALI